MGKKSLIVCTMLVLIFISGQAIAGSAWVKKQIGVIYGNIQIYIDGNHLSTDIEPFIYNGSTMVPLRVVSEALGEPVVWDGVNNRVLIGSKHNINVPAQPKPKVETKYLEDMLVLRNVGPFFKNQFVIAHRPFAHGVAAEISKGAPKAEFVIDLKGKYKKLAGYVGVDDSTQNSSGGFKLEILGNGEQLLVSSKFSPGQYPAYIETNVSGYETLIFKVERFDVSTGDYNEVKAALANFKLQ
ncbi:NPCBM/NEW2 domain-containing protein [Metallumcola ferriviriculae]|uniref:NPCBM/NEW2 domain-containing protein n=1 Tax=Metallumcola ferriviriculae TaxID=3039180 RepID=A0AAU0UV01_9FIRM|nr:NPCBM/NEW2 domain-containing protein [Desulfitibacteraceae bacterium MK1]